MTSTFRKRSRVIYKNHLPPGHTILASWYTTVSWSQPDPPHASLPTRWLRFISTSWKLGCAPDGAQTTTARDHYHTHQTYCIEYENQENRKKKVAEVANIKNLTGSIRKLIYWAHFHHFLFPQISIHFQYLNLLSLSALLNCRAIFLCFLQDLQWSAADRWHPDFEMAPMCGNRNCA